MKKIFLTLALIIIFGVVVYYTLPYKYWFVKLLSVINDRGNEYSTTSYSGYVGIERTTFDEIKETLKERGCAEMGSEFLGSKCLYQRRQLENAGDSLVVYPRGMGWGPVSFAVTESRLFFGKDIPGKPDLGKLKAEVRKDASFTGVKIRENYWRVTDVKYPWDAVY